MKSKKYSYVGAKFKKPKAEKKADVKKVEKKPVKKKDDFKSEEKKYERPKQPSRGFGGGMFGNDKDC